MPIYISDSWQYGTSSPESFWGDRDDVVRDDAFQISGSESETAGGVNNNWDDYNGGEGDDRIYVSAKSGYIWTALMIADGGLNGVEKIEFHPDNILKPIYFHGDVDFSGVTSMSAGVQIFGRGNDNTFTGGSLGEYVEGDGGNDHLYGNGGNDTLYGDSTSSNPWVVNLNAAGNDELYGGEGDDTLYGGGGNDFPNAGTGSNTVYGGSGADTFYVGDRGATVLIRDFSATEGDKIQIAADIADDFSDLTVGSITNQVTIGDITINVLPSPALTPHDFILPGIGDDTANEIHGGSANNTNNTLYGGGGDDHLYGEHGNDLLYGEAGNDFLDGGTGSNNVYGGSGTDTFYFGDHGASTFIWDFSAAERDKIHIATDIADDFSDLTIVKRSNFSTSVTIGDVAINVLLAPTLTASDFVFV